MTPSWRCWFWKLGIASCLAMGGAIAVSGDCALAQIKPDGTLPNNSIVNPQGNTSRISGGTQAGSNLFHSFDEFSIPTGGAAYFNNALDIQNIISRVTGGSVSNIDGLLRANGTANLFLLNPNGIIFGPNARLDIRGSFVGSTASSLNFADGNQFSAQAPQATPLLTVSVPLGLQYGGTTPGRIVNQSQAINSTGKTLALVGGDVSLDGGTLRAPGGRVELGGLAGAGTVGLNVDSNNLGLSFPVGVQRADVSLTNGANVNVISAGGGGSIAVNARNIDVLEGSGLWAGIGKGLDSVTSQAGDITLNATEAITVDGVSKFSSGAVSRVGSGAVGNGGDINITTESLWVTNGAQLAANTLGKGDAGSVNIHAGSKVFFDGVGSNKLSSAAVSRVESGAVGNGGNINITTRSLEVRNGARLSARTFEKGDAGSVNIHAGSKVSFDGVGSNGSSSGAFSTVEKEAMAKGGDINITTESLSVTAGAQLATNTQGQGDAGSVNIHSGSKVSFDGKGINELFSAAVSRVETGAVGKGGDVNIKTGSLEVRNGARLSARTFGTGNAGSVNIYAGSTVSFDKGNAFSTVEEGAVGDGGDIDIKTGSLSVTDGVQLTASTRGQGDAGSVKINARNTVSFKDSAAFSTVESEAIGKAKAGDINIKTGSLSFTNGAALVTSTRGQGNAGSVKINARNTVSFDGVGRNQFKIRNAEIDRRDGSSVTINVRDPASFAGEAPKFSSGVLSQVDSKDVGNAGSVSITAGSLFVTNDAVLTASTNGKGNAGSVTINATTFKADSGGQVLTTTSSSGNAGDITINKADSITLSGSGSGLLANTTPESTGKGGSIFVNPVHQLTIADGAGIAVDSKGKKDAGKLRVQADSVTLDSKAFLSAKAEKGSGGRIELHVPDLLLMRRESRISATSTDFGKQGDITINTGILVALENSDIIANSFASPGSDITITAQAIFGTQVREQLSPESDITATGAVELVTPNIDPSQGLDTLPAQLVEVSGLINTGCAALGENEFIVTGRGGLPPNPRDPLNSEMVWTDLRTFTQQAENLPSSAVSTPLTDATTEYTEQLVEAQGWVINNKGEVVLTATAPNVTPHWVSQGHRCPFPPKN